MLFGVKLKDCSHGSKSGEKQDVDIAKSFSLH